MPTPRHYPLHLIIIPIMELALMLAIAAYITTIDMNLLYLLSIPLGASIAYFLSPRTIEDYYDHDYTKYEQSITLMVSNLLCLMVVTYYNTPVFVAILVYVGIYSITERLSTMTYYNLHHTHHKRDSWIRRLLSMTRHGWLSAWARKRP